jgi:regulator of sirC expression with transglutaminase-like and TPR domain
LEEGAFLIAKQAYPNVDMHIYSDLLNFFAAEFQSRLDPSDSPEEIAAKIGNYFSHEKGFSGNEADYYNTDNHYINKVIETKRGVPIALSVIYMLVLRRLNFPVQGNWDARTFHSEIRIRNQFSICRPISWRKYPIIG